MLMGSFVMCFFSSIPAITMAPSSISQEFSTFCSWNGTQLMSVVFVTGTEKYCFRDKIIFQKCLNVRQKLGTRNTAKLTKLPISHSLTLDMMNNFCFHVSAQKSLSHSLSLSHSFNLSFTHSRHAEQLLFSSLCSKLSVYSQKLQCFFGCP